MKITYIGHSGFAVELAGCALLFDYYEGTLPAFNSESRCMFFQPCAQGSFQLRYFQAAGNASGCDLHPFAGYSAQLERGGLCASWRGEGGI